MDLIGVQFDVTWEVKPDNVARIRELLTAAGPAPGSLIVLPEMCTTGFSMNVAGIAELPGGPVEGFIASLATYLKCFILGGVVTPAPDGRGRNEAVAFNPDGEEIARYCKIHPFSYAGEDEHYVAGDDVALFEWGGFTVAPLICYDLRFPETFRAAVARGANLLPVLANWPAARAEHWAALLTARAIENQAYVIGVNRCGSDPNCTDAGGSVMIDPRGNVVAAAGEEQCALSAPVDLSALQAYRHDFPVLDDRRA